MTLTPFTPYGKTPRFNREVIVTEKVDGTNAAVLIDKVGEYGATEGVSDLPEPDVLRYVHLRGEIFAVRAASRNRLLSCEADNFGFAAWVRAYALNIVRDLGPGVHRGEWCGRGIQRGYGLAERYFLLFSPPRYGVTEPGQRRPFATPRLNTVPFLATLPEPEPSRFRGLAMRAEWDSDVPYYATGEEKIGVAGEGIIAYHTASRQVYKVLAEADDRSKTEAGIA